MTDNPLFDSLTEEQKQQYPCWKNFSQCKSKVLTELYRKTPKSGYSCDMIIIDDVIDEQYGQPVFLAPTSDGTDPMQKLLDDYKIWYDSQVLSAFRIPESATKAGVANTAELQSKLVAKKLDEELYAKFGIRHANSEQELQKTWGRNY
jgi:hypothetical protein